MSFLDKLLGKPLRLREHKQQALSVWTGVPALGLDALASTAYGPEAALMILLPIGLLGLHYFLYITFGVIIILFTLYLSYQQTAAAYPNGGGAYIVASDNLGRKVGVWAAVALLFDYLLNVAVGISAGVGAVVSAFPLLHHYTLILCLFILATLMVLNLRGVRESGLAFGLPTLLFVVCLGLTFIIGLIKIWLAAGEPQSIVAPPPFPSATSTLGAWLLLGSFANGLTAMSGVESVSNAVPLFRKPSVRNARLTLTFIVFILGLFLLALGYLCPSYHVLAMDETKPGYQTILSQIVLAVTGRGIFYYISIISIFIVLIYSAQTSFVGFPRVCRLLAEDNFLPHFFADRGRRLVFSQGIIILTFFSGVLLIIFNGITLLLIPLFALGAFSAFFFSQTGMVVYWFRNKTTGWHIKLFCNALGACTTFCALIAIAAVKFLKGAWIVIVLTPIIVFLLNKIQKHYQKVSNEIENPIKLKVHELKAPTVIIPIQGLDRVAERAVQFGLLLSDDITALYIDKGTDDVEHLQTMWSKYVVTPAKVFNVKPKLEIIKSPYRRIYKPVLDYVKRIKKGKTNRLVAVIIPELIEPHWYEYLLHNVHVTALRALLFLSRDQRTVVITIPWYLRERSR